MPEAFDVTVIGAGPGGYVAAIRAAQVGLKTAIIEKDKDLGGTCLLRGCIPTKELLHAAHVYDLVNDPTEFGVSVEGFKLHFDKVMARKNRVVSKLSKGVDFLMRKNKITVFKGAGRFEGRGHVTVRDSAGLTREIPTKNVIIATGSAPRLLPGLEIKSPRVVTSDELLDFDHVPKSMIVLGAGAVGVEFASVFKRFSTDVTIIEMLDRLVPIEDEETSAELQRAFRRRGITSLVNTRFESAKVNENGVEVTYTGADGKRGTISAETLLVPWAAARTPTASALRTRDAKSIAASSKSTSICARPSRTSTPLATSSRRHYWRMWRRRKAAWPPNTSRGATRIQLITTACPIALTANPKSAAWV
jgi:dihydrolipoamide dehydrogenase